MCDETATLIKAHLSDDKVARLTEEMEAPAGTQKRRLTRTEPRAECRVRSTSVPLLREPSEKQCRGLQVGVLNAKTLLAGQTAKQVAQMDISISIDSLTFTVSGFMPVLPIRSICTELDGPSP